MGCAPEVANMIRRRKPALRGWLTVSAVVWLVCLLPHVIERSQAQTPEKLVPFAQEDEQSELWGYKNSAGEVVIKPRFMFAGEEFSPEGIAGVMEATGPAYIDRKGNVLVRTVNYDIGPDRFSEGVARCIGDDGTIGFFDKWGRIVIQPQFGWADQFREGLAAVCSGCRSDIAYAGVERGGKWGYINHKGAFVITPQFGYAFPFVEGLAAVCTGCKLERMEYVTVVRGGKWGYVNRKGAFVVTPQFDYAFSFEKRLAEVCLGCADEAMGEHSMVTGGKWASINKHGKIVIPFRPHQMGD